MPLGTVRSPMKNTFARMAVALGVTVAVVAPFAGTAAAVVVPPPTPRNGALTQVGPLADHGFPSWYRDSNGVRLEPCVTLNDPLCSALPDTVADPNAPISFPSNFPDEM